MTDEKISQAEKDEAAYFAERAKAQLGRRGVRRSGADAHTLFDVQEMELNFGPQHPSTHGVLRVVLKVDGEKIVSAKPDIGYLHRGTEKLFETETYPMGIPHTDRLDYVAAATNNHAYCLGGREAARRRDPAARAATSASSSTSCSGSPRTSSGSGPRASTSARSRPSSTPSASARRSSTSSRSTAARA